MGATFKQIQRVGNAILSLYHQEPLLWLEPLHPNSLVGETALAKLEGRGGKGEKEGEEREKEGKL